MKSKSILCSAVIYILVLSSLVYSGLSAQVQSDPTAQQLIKIDPKQLEGKSPCNCLADTKVITFYENESIPAEMGISSGVYTKVEGYRYINITVEFDQRAAAEKPVTLSVMFGFSSTAELGSGKYINLENSYTNSADPMAIMASGKNSWMGSPHNISRYTVRIPIMAPYIQVFPYNLESRTRRVTIKAYLST